MYKPASSSEPARNHIQASEQQRTGEKRTGESFLRIEDFAGAVGAELPSLVSPQDRDHRQTEIGEERESALRGAYRGRNFASVMPQSEKHNTEDDDDSNLDESGPILEVSALACAPDIYDGHNGDHCHGNHC